MWLFDKIIPSLKKKEYKHPKVTFIPDTDPEFTHTMPIKTNHPTQHYIIKTGGEYHIYDSLDEIEPEFRATIENFNDNDKTAPFTIFVDGERKTYSNASQLPQNIRDALKIFEKNNK